MWSTVEMREFRSMKTTGPMSILWKCQIFNNVWGVAVANDGSLFVSDFGADKILVFDAAGNLTGSWGESGSLNHQLNGPSDLQIGPEETSMLPIIKTIRSSGSLLPDNS